MAALEDEAPRIAAHVLAALREEHFGMRRHGDEEMLLALCLEVLRQAPILQRLGREARERDIAQRPQRQVTGEAVRGLELQVEWEISRRDGVMPVAAPVMCRRFGRGDRRLHGRVPSAAPSLGRGASACNLFLVLCATSQMRVPRLQRRGAAGSHRVHSWKGAQDTAMGRNRLGEGQLPLARRPAPPATARTA